MPDPHDILHSSLKRILEQRETLPRDAARDLLGSILDNAHSPASPEQQIRIAALLGALAARGETIDELAGFVDALRARVIRIPLTEPERAQMVDTCGTGGDLSGTFNISTASALVAAAAGARVAKHGNRAVTSSCGSADVLEALGIPVDQTPEQAAAALRTHGFAFLAAPSLQPAMKAIMPIRRAIGVRTAFNILGPMTNPAGAQAQVIGVYAEKLVPIVAETLARLNTRHAFVVHGFDATTGAGMDEISISGPTQRRRSPIRRGDVLDLASIQLRPAPRSDQRPRRWRRPDQCRNPTRHLFRRTRPAPRYRRHQRRRRARHRRPRCQFPRRSPPRAGYD